MMNKIVSIALIFLLIQFVAFCSACLVSAADKPSIIIFLADDLGYADIGVNGCKDIPTPNVDAIATHNPESSIRSTATKMALQRWKKFVLTSEIDKKGEGSNS